MEFFDFISEEEIQSLPLDDGPRAFVGFVRISDKRLQDRLREVEGTDYANASVEEAQYGFMNVVYAAASNFGIPPFASEQLPLRDKFGWEAYRQFRANLSHYIGQIVFQTAKADHSHSAVLTDPIRKSLREHIATLRDAIENSHLPEERKKSLHKRLDALEEELKRDRIRFSVAAGVVITVLSLPGALWTSYEAVMEASALIMRDLGQAQATEDDNRHQQTTETPVALTPPRTRMVDKKVPDFSRDEMDDEIPF